MKADAPKLPGNDVISFRRALFLATGIGLLALGTWMLLQRYLPGGISPLEWILTSLFVLLFTPLAFGFSIAFWGFAIRIFGGDPYQVMGTLPAVGKVDAIKLNSTAVVMPVFNEDVGRVFRGLEAMVRSIDATGQAEAFDFYVLSDSNQPNQWIAEESAWVDLCGRVSGFGRIFYRKRRVSLHGKSGNIADFCRRWGRRYRNLVILDADSVMSGELLVRMAAAMSANPQIGIIQTVPTLMRGTSLWQRLTQFSTAVAGPIFAAGSNFWHLAGGSYWGHNAIIRLQPFMEHCGLPELPGDRSDTGRHIMSHDTVEASLMQQAGYQVWLAADEPGSYEEGPPNLTESLKRDRRWCQGNLQHFWFLLAPDTPFSNRIHIFFGLMAYLTSPLLLLSIVLGAFDYYWKTRHALLSLQPEDSAWQGNGNWSMDLFWLTVALLFLPKIFGCLASLPKVRQFGGLLRLSAGTLLDTFLSILIAPVMMYFHAKFVLMAMLGLRVAWKTQTRSGGEITFKDALQQYWQPTLAGVLSALLFWYFVPELLVWLSPLVAGWILAIPVAMFTASETAGSWLRQRGILGVVEESAPPVELSALDDPAGNFTPFAIDSLRQVFLSPNLNAIHLSMLRRRRINTPHKNTYLEILCQRLCESGPDSLDRREMMALLWDSESMTKIHSRLWRMESEKLHPTWLEAINLFR